MYDTLQGVITGGTDRVSQITALYVLDHFIKLLVKTQEQDFVYHICKKYLVIFNVKFNYLLNRNKLLNILLSSIF